MDTITEVLQTATRMFMRYGIKSVSMDDISRELGVSKKTLYQYVSDKKNLVHQSVAFHFAEDRRSCDEVINSQSNPISQLMNIAKHVTQSMSDLNPSTIFDLQKYYPKTWKLFESYREGYIIDCIKLNIESGKKEGLYRDNIDTDIASHLYVWLMETAINSDLARKQKLSYSSLVVQIINYHLHALMSEKGRKYLEKHVQSLTI